jgi:hypothetical protein
MSKNTQPFFEGYLKERRNARPKPASRLCCTSRLRSIAPKRARQKIISLIVPFIVTIVLIVVIVLRWQKYIFPPYPPNIFSEIGLILTFDEIRGGDASQNTK